MLGIFFDDLVEFFYLEDRLDKVSKVYKDIYFGLWNWFLDVKNFYEFLFFWLII